jgi:hypothetical protein
MLKNLCKKVKEMVLCRTVFHLLGCTVYDVIDPQNFSGKSLSNTFSTDLKSGIKFCMFCIFVGKISFGSY